MSYEGQIHRLRVPVAADEDAGRLRERFVAQYRTEYGTELGDLDVVVVNARTVVNGRRAATAGALQPRSSRHAAADRTPTGLLRDVDRDPDLRAGGSAPRDLTLPGPMIVEQADTTVVIEPEMDVTVDAILNLIVRRR